MARFRVASRASFRSRRLSVSARFSFRLDVWLPELEELEELERYDRMAAEIEQYTTPAEVRDLGAALLRYPDDDTEEIRAVLTDRLVRPAIGHPAVTVDGPTASGRAVSPA